MKCIVKYGIGMILVVLSVALRTDGMSAPAAELSHCHAEASFTSVEKDCREVVQYIYYVYSHTPKECHVLHYGQHLSKILSYSFSEHLHHFAVRTPESVGAGMQSALSDCAYRPHVLYYIYALEKIVV